MSTTLQFQFAPGQAPTRPLEYDDWQVREFLREKYARFHEYERARVRAVSLAGYADVHFLRASSKRKDAP